jgi:cyclase
LLITYSIPNGKSPVILSGLNYDTKKIISMNRKSFIRNTALAGAGFFINAEALASFLGLKEYKIRMLRRNVGIFTERGGTIGFLQSKDGYTIIDSQFPDTSKNLIEALKKQAPLPFKYLLNTHHHADHTGGNISFKGLVEKIIAHKNCLINLQTVAEKNKNADKQLFPTETFNEDMKIKLKDEKIKALYYGAGHTNGDAIFYFEKANIMHVGDLMFNKRHPFVDRSAGANMKSWMNVLDKIYSKAEKDTIIIFGHSLNAGEETGSREDLMKFKDYLGKVLDFADASIKKGMSKDEFIKSTAIPGVTEWTGQGIERPLTAAYEELTQPKA